MVEVLMLAVIGELSAWQTKWEPNGQTFFYKYKDYNCFVTVCDVIHVDGLHAINIQEQCLVMIYALF